MIEGPDHEYTPCSGATLQPAQTNRPKTLPGQLQMDERPEILRVCRYAAHA